jgi:hypothetical protein
MEIKDTRNKTAAGMVNRVSSVPDSNQTSA